MEDVTRLTRHCPRCGRALSQDAPEGLCAACLFAAGTETLTRSITDEAPTVSSAHGDWAAPDTAGHQLGAGQSWGPYRIGRLLGRGGMGEVYEAEHTETGRRIALKVLRSRLQNADDRARFLREGQLAASISHPHTVYIFGSEEISSMPVISMELLSGGTLKERVAAQGPLPPAEAVSAVLDIIGGLDAAQSAGILHRDIKPSNCFIDSDGSVKVGDFGLSISTLARDVHHDLSSNGFEGTPQFAPPEQLRGEPLDVRADIYAVGATLYYLLTGQPPFDARDLRDLVVRVTTEPPKSPRLIRREIPSGLASVVMQCLTKTPSQRPASYAALADALRPFSSREDTPAPPGLRLLAGVLDSFIVGLPVAAWRTWSDTLTQLTTTAAIVGAWTWLLTFAYYFGFEGYWGTSLGKRLFGLRVTSSGGATASWLRIARRTFVFHLPHMLMALMVSSLVLTGSGGAGGAITWNTIELARSIGTIALLAALFLTARHHNGWAALHDLVSGTRVVLRSAAGARRVGAPAVVSPPLTPAVAMPAELRYGPFTPVSDAGDTGSGRLIVAFDPVLRRQVWIHVVPPQTPAISTARRDVSRAGRLHWLTGRRSVDEDWDAFEAPDGGPFLTRHDSAPEWPTVTMWLLDLAHELAASTGDGSTPALGLDRVWIRNDGHLVLLDFSAFAGAPHVATPASVRQADAAGARGAAIPASPRNGFDGPDLAPVGLLSAVAMRGLSMATHTPGAPPLVPLSARALIDHMSGPTPPALEEARDALINAAAAPDRVKQWRRAVPIGLASAPVLIVLVSALLLLPSLFRFMGSPNAAILGWLDLLHRPNPPGSRLTDPEIRDAVEKYVAGRYGGVLNDEGFWNTTIMQQGLLAEWRQTAAEITARHPSVSAEELSRVSAIIAPEIENSERYRKSRSPSVVGMGGGIISPLTALSLAFVLCCSVLSSVLVPGGMVTRVLGLAVVRRDGKEITRWQSLARVLLAWLPAIMWLAYLSTAPKIQGWVPAPASPLLGASLTLGVLALGAAWTIAKPTRGPHDRLMGTWIVPR